MLRVYFHIDELGRDAIVASSLKSYLFRKDIKLTYGNRLISDHFLKNFHKAFDVVIFPKPSFLESQKNIKEWYSSIITLQTEGIGMMVHPLHEKFGVRVILDKSYVEGNSSYVDQIYAICVWGERAREIVNKYHPEVIDKIRVVGHPRLDRNCLGKNEGDSNKIGIITRYTHLNDFDGRTIIDFMGWDSLVGQNDIVYKNNSTGDKLKNNYTNIGPDRINKEVKELDTTFKIIRKLLKLGYEIELRVHPREDRHVWERLIRDLNLDIKVSNWLTPYLKWASKMDYIVGPASTSYYECLAIGITPISFSEIPSKDDAEIVSDEISAILKHVYSPTTLQELTNYIGNHQKIDINTDLSARKILEDEINYPDCIDSTQEICNVIMESAKNKEANNATRELNYLLFSLMLGMYNLKESILRRVKRYKNQGSNFVMTRKIRNKIDNLINSG